MIVVEREPDGWTVRHHGILRATRPTKAEAVDAGRYLARKFGTQLKVRRENGAHHFGMSFEYGRAS